MNTVIIETIVSVLANLAIGPPSECQEKGRQWPS
jgi:hypothetical protein